MLKSGSWEFLEEVKQEIEKEQIEDAQLDALSKYRTIL